MKKTRKVNFSERELLSLLEAVSERFGIISSKFSDCVTNGEKDKAWRGVVTAVNSVGKTERTVSEIKKKWEDMKSRTKKRANEVKKDRNGTGGGEPQVKLLSPMESRILSLIGDTAAYGITGAIDTNAPETSDVESEPMKDENSEPETETVTSPKQRKIQARSVKRALKTEYEDYSSQLVALEKERLETEKERLQIEKRRLYMEEQRVKIEERRLIIEESRWQMDIFGRSPQTSADTGCGDAIGTALRICEL